MYNRLGMSDFITGVDLELCKTLQDLERIFSKWAVRFVHSARSDKFLLQS
jgi:hypothetical protein